MDTAKSTHSKTGSTIKIIEKLGCEFIDEVSISPNEGAYLKGERTKRRYRWYL